MAVTVGSPVRVERPGDPDALARVMRACDASGEAIVLHGGDTLGSLGFAPEQCDVAIDLRGLDRVVAYEASDLTIGVECGMTVETLDRTLAAHGQFVALDVPQAAIATVGGSLAAGWLGPRRATYGRMRDAIIGSTAVLADGTIARAGGMVVKNVTGYDLSRLYVGSLGSLVAIASVNFKTSPIPTRRVALRASIPRGARAHAIDAVRHADVEPTAALITIGYAAELDDDAQSDGSLLVIFEGSEALTARGIRGLTGLLAANGIALAAVERGASDALAAAVDVSIAPVDGSTSIYKTFGSPAGLEARYAAVRSIADAHAATLEAILDSRTGDLIARLTPARASDETSLALDAAIHARPERALVLRAPENVRGRLCMWGRTPGGLSVMRGLKARFDPKRTLAPGRYVDRL